MRTGRVWISAFVLLSSAVGCVWGRPPDVAAPIRSIVDSARPDGVTDTAWNDLREFYAGRLYQPAWWDETGQRVRIAFDVLRTAGDHGLNEDDYGARELRPLFDASYGDGGDARGGSSASVDGRARRAAELDVRTTAALLALARDVALGHEPPAIEPKWPVRRQLPDLAASLSAAVDSDLRAWLDSVRPHHPEYAALQKALADLRQRARNGEPGLEAARARIALNLDRWRWMPDDLGARHVLVNIPSFQLAVREHGQTIETMKVVVGTLEDKTPIFSAEMKSLVFSPYWNVPESIVEGETAPAAARDPKFLARNQIEILRRSTRGIETVDPSTVDWNDIEALKHLAFRQKPGAGNALGHVKFLFPNPYSVYLHDTPADELFAREGRAFSHGCVRIERPEALARWVLKGRPEWDDRKIAEAMFSGVEKHMIIPEPIQVHIAYFTVWVDEAGGLQHGPDLYGYDAMQRASRSGT